MSSPACEIQGRFQLQVNNKLQYNESSSCSCREDKRKEINHVTLSDKITFNRLEPSSYVRVQGVDAWPLTLFFIPSDNWVIIIGCSTSSVPLWIFFAPCPINH